MTEVTRVFVNGSPQWWVEDPAPDMLGPFASREAAERAYQEKSLYAAQATKVITPQPIFISVDIETNGPIPGEHAMLSCALVAFDARGAVLRELSVNLVPPSETHPDPDTMTWWASYPEAWRLATCQPQLPRAAMVEIVTWLEVNFWGCTLTLLGYPAVFDWQFLNWYFVKYLGPAGNPFGHASIIDVKSYALAHLHARENPTLGLEEINKATIARLTGSASVGTHVAIEDARAQGEWFFALWRANTASAPSSLGAASSPDATSASTSETGHVPDSACPDLQDLRASRQEDTKLGTTHDLGGECAERRTFEVDADGAHHLLRD